MCTHDTHEHKRTRIARRRSTKASPPMYVSLVLYFSRSSSIVCPLVFHLCDVVACVSYMVRDTLFMSCIWFLALIRVTHICPNNKQNTRGISVHHIWRWLTHIQSNARRASSLRLLLTSTLFVRWVDVIRPKIYRMHEHDSSIGRMRKINLASSICSKSFRSSSRFYLSDGMAFGHRLILSSQQTICGPKMNRRTEAVRMKRWQITVQFFF